MRSEDRPTDHVPPDLRGLIDLFDGPLADVQFPGVDRQTLAAASARLHARALAVDEARRALDTAQGDFDAELDAFREFARRAVAYIQIYATDDPQLKEAVTAIGLGDSDKPARKGGARRQRAKKPTGPELPLSV